MNILDGVLVRDSLIKDLKDKVSSSEDRFGLAVIEIGEDPSSKVYVRQKEKFANEVGYLFKHIKLDSDVSYVEVARVINNLNNDEEIDGIILQSPIPDHLNFRSLVNLIDSNKDVDGLTDVNMGKLCHNDYRGLASCTPKGIISLIDHYGIEIEGKHVVIVGRSDLVGRPLSMMMTNRNATVTLCHSRTKDLKSYTLKADILVVAIGRANFITKDYVKDGAVVIDVGITRMSDNSLCGDVLYDEVKDIASYITPVPGGVGPMTVASLLTNTYKAHVLRKKL